ncbi:hypothetical protein L1987_46711 [Smallanthus sonchifolius]|uniref:Uncharacterized protein n=1 Tax=Smallanthus sonchifolius TaxID=185202 RepID=A0ACB9G1I0_9ASTR|nr:hypothetical protein L1987_46711 [Smallanthus sonchifolius]
MLQRLLRQQFYCFLDGFSGYFLIPIAPEDQEKTTFTCPYGTFVYRRMPFGLYNAPTTFQRCIVAIFHDMIEDSMEVFMDDFSIFRSSFDHCLESLEKMMACYEETNLVLNWEKMPLYGARGHCARASDFRGGMRPFPNSRPHTSVKSIRSFLGHADFYHRFIRDFSKISRPMTQLLEKDGLFFFLSSAWRCLSY